MRIEYFYLTSDKSNILHEEFSYDKHKSANKSGKITCICGNAKVLLLLQLKECLVLKRPGENYNGRGILNPGYIESRDT
jgi:hypothetical protein